MLYICPIYVLLLKDIYVLLLKEKKRKEKKRKSSHFIFVDIVDIVDNCVIIPKSNMHIFFILTFLKTVL